MNITYRFSKGCHIFDATDIKGLPYPVHCMVKGGVKKEAEIYATWLFQKDFPDEPIHTTGWILQNTDLYAPVLAKRGADGALSKEGMVA